MPRLTLVVQAVVLDVPWAMIVDMLKVTLTTTPRQIASEVPSAVWTCSSQPVSSRHSVQIRPALVMDISGTIKPACAG